MALILLTLHDKPDGSVVVNLETEPSVAFAQAHFTLAQKLGATALNAIHEQLAKTPPRLVVVGADELPH